MTFFGLPPFLPLAREAAAFLADLIDPRATAAGCLAIDFTQSRSDCRQHRRGAWRQER